MEKRRFEALWNRSTQGGAGTDAGAVYDEVLARYSEPHRRYHTPGHIDHCLGQFDQAVGLMEEPDAVEMAIWFHDVIYVSRATDNERQSAALFLERVGDASPQRFRDKVYALIMVTIHRDPPQTLDERFVVDIDLSSFGLPWDQFERDSAGVREEFPHLSDEQFYPRQREFLESLLARETFCFTEFFRARHEARAREQITRYLETLAKKGFA